MNWIKRIIYFIMVLFVVFDLTYSFYQYSSQSLDGDLQESLVPSEEFDILFSSPFGCKAIFENKKYPNTNRFFGHFTLKMVFTEGVWSLQNFTDPVDSVYLAAAISKLLFHFFILFLLAACITGSFRFYKFDFVLSLALLSPLIQVHGYGGVMGITNVSITYSFFYSFPSIFLIIVLLPFIFLRIHSKNLFKNIPFVVLYVLFVLVANFSGPLNPGTFLIFFLVLISGQILQDLPLQSGSFFKRIFKGIYNLPKHFWFVALPVCVVSLYSFYLGTYNSNNEVYHKDLIERYLLLPNGLIMQFFGKVGYSLVFIILLINYYVLKYKVKTDSSKRIIQAYHFVLIFSIIYILLLPLGGYKSYRPFILRSDTIIPITLSFFFLFGISTLAVIKVLKNRLLVAYLVVLIGFLTILQKHDKIVYENTNEKMALRELSQSSDQMLVFKNNFTIVAWEITEVPERSNIKIELCKIWNIIDKDDHKQFYQTADGLKSSE